MTTNANYDANEIYSVDDIAELKISDVNQVAEIILQRLSAGLQYTKVGDNMLVIIRSIIVPKTPTSEAIHMERNFAQKLRESLSAAVSMVNKILSSMSVEEEPNQSIIFLGDHLSGKSDALIRMLSFFKTASLVVSNRKANVIGDLVIKSCQLAETFGHTRTTKHNNCCRIAKYIKIYHANQENNLELLSWTIDIIPFDRSRVYGAHSGRPHDIGNYHIFYQLACGLTSVNKHLASKLKLTAVKHFTILSSTFASKLLPGIDLELPNDLSSFMNTVQTFRLLGFHDSDQNAIYAVLAAVMHLGNISVSCNFHDMDDRRERVKLVYMNDQPEHSMNIHDISAILGISSSEFESIITKWPLADGQPLYAMFESTIILEIKMRIHKVMEFLYWQVVSCIVLSLNQRFHENINYDDTSSSIASYLKYVSFIDFPGFEDNYPYNSLESLFINYANERLSSHGNQYFSYLINQYESKSEEAIVGVPSPSDHVDVIDLLCRDKVGIFHILNKFSRIQAAAGCSDDVSMLLSQRHPAGIDILTSSQHNKQINHGFRIIHYNHTTISYDIEGFIEKNRIGHDIITGLDKLLSSSSEAFIRRLAKLFTTEQVSPRLTSIIINPKPGHDKSIITANEMISSQLDAIVQEMSMTNNRFIVCLDNPTSSSSSSVPSSPIRPSSTSSSMMMSPSNRSTLSSPTNRNSRSTPSKSSSSSAKNTPKKSSSSSFDFKAVDTSISSISSSALSSSSSSYDSFVLQLQAYHVPHILALQRAKYPVILSHMEFLSVAIIFARAKGWYLHHTVTADELASRSSSLASSLLSYHDYSCGKLTIMFISSSYASSIHQQGQMLLEHDAIIIQSCYRRYHHLRRYHIMIASLIKLQSCFRRCIWKKMMIRVMMVRRERRGAAQRQQEQDALHQHMILEQQEMERQLQEQFQISSSSSSTSSMISSPASSMPSSRSVSFIIDKKQHHSSSPSSSSSMIPISPLTSSKSILSSPARPASQQSPPNRMTLTPPPSRPNMLARQQQQQQLSSRTAAWIDSLPAAGLSDDPDSSSSSSSSSSSMLSTPLMSSSSSYPASSMMTPPPPPPPPASSKPLNRYTSFSPTLLNTGNNDDATDPIILSKRLDAYHILTSSFLSLYRKYTLHRTLDALYDAIYRKKPNIMADIISMIRTRRVEEADSLPYVKNKLLSYRNLYHLAVSVGSIECINSMGVTMMDIIVYDDAKNNWLHMMMESPNMDFLTRVHSFIQRYDQVIHTIQPNRALYASILSIIATPATLCTGWLYKLSSSDKLQKRYVVLTANKIFYYNNFVSDDNIDAKNASDGLLVSVDQTVIRHNREMENSFILDSISDMKSVKGKKRFIFKASSRDEYHQWLKALSQVTTIATTRDPSSSTSSSSSSSSVPVNIVNPMITRLWVSEVNIFGDTPLHRLAEVQVITQDPIIMHQKSSSTIMSEFEDTYHILSIASWLIEHHCPLDAPNHRGLTALDLAIKSSSYDLASYMIRKGALTHRIQDSVLKEIEARDCFKGRIYPNLSDAPHLPAPDKWYNFTYFSMMIQEIHLSSSPSAPSSSSSSSMMSYDAEYWTKTLSCPYIIINVYDAKGRMIESSQQLGHCAYRGSGMLIWGQCYHLQTPLQAMDNRAIIEIILMNYNHVTRASEEISKGEYELDFTNVNSGPSSIYMQPSSPVISNKSSKSNKTSSASSSAPSYDNGYTLIADIALTQRHFELQASSFEEYVITTYDDIQQNATGYNYKLVYSKDRHKDTPYVRFLANLPTSFRPNDILKHVGGKRGVHIKIPSDAKANEKLLIEASVKKVYGRSYFYHDIENQMIYDEDDNDNQSVGSASRRGSSRSSSPRMSRSRSNSRSSSSFMISSPNRDDESRKSLSRSPSRASATSSANSSFMGTPDRDRSSSIEKRGSTTPRRKILHKSSIYLRSGI